MTPSRSKYGPAVIGEDQYEEEREIVRNHRDKYGPAVLEHHPANTEEAVNEDPVGGPIGPDETEDDLTVDEAENLIDAAAGEDDYANLAEFREALGEDPAKVAPFLQVELNREDGPRKGALQSLRKVEVAGENRPDVLTMIDDALEDLDAG